MNKRQRKKLMRRPVSRHSFGIFAHIKAQDMRDAGGDCLTEEVFEKFIRKVWSFGRVHNK